MWRSMRGSASPQRHVRIPPRRFGPRARKTCLRDRVRSQSSNSELQRSGRPRCYADSRYPHNDRHTDHVDYGYPLLLL
jgi:hypothetical protein